jgi:hypothetical protein
MAKIRPEAPVRRFDVFAEYSRLEAIREKGMSAAKAKGYGLWLAKVVAAQKFGRLPRPAGEKAEEKRPKKKWRELSGVPQTDKLFDREIIGRLGRGFYSRVFSPTIKKAYEAGESYEDIRDAVRRDWKPA